MHYHVKVRRWFDKANRNAYHSVVVLFSDGTRKVRGMTSGYGSQYEQTAVEMILGESPKYKNGLTMAPWRWYDLNGHTVSYDVVDVPKERDLHSLVTGR
jgi:hypothetical protein